MSKFKKKRGNTSPAISTASLPDIVFMLLFFFMVVTVIKNDESKLNITIPKADQLIKLEDQSVVFTMRIGKPLAQYQEQYGSATQLQINDKFVTTDDIQFYLEEKKVKLPEEKRNKIVGSLHIDNKVKMGFVQDVKTELRKAGQLVINYAATQGAVTGGGK